MSRHVKTPKHNDETRGDDLRAGEIISAHGRHYLVELDDGIRLQCYPKGKKSVVACGDRVQVRSISADQGSIESIDPRSTLLYRSDKYREKLFAANVTQIAVVVACVPSFYDELVTRCLVAASQQGLHSLIVLNKCDMVEETQAALRRLAIYTELGYEVLQLSARADVAPLRAHLTGQRTLLVGQSGMGKSTLINALLPEADARVADISVALDSGRHTTTFTRLYRLDAQSAIFDSPGLQEFGLAHLNQSDLEQAFPEFRPLLGRCRFSNCAHLSEPDCAITARDAGVHPERLRIYQKLLVEWRTAAQKY